MNNLRYIGTLAIGLFAWTSGGDAASVETRPPPPPLPPISKHANKWLNPQPDPPKKFSTTTNSSAALVSLSTSPSPWQPLVNRPPFNPGAMIQLTDGTLMVHDQGAKNNGSSDWWRLTPDINGSYLNGTWSKLASLPSGYAPLYFASAVLPGGRVIIVGGEFNNGQKVLTNLGAIYEPLFNTWTPVPPPKGPGWSIIGASPSIILANGTFMIGGQGTNQQALFNTVNLSWTFTGSGKADGNDEEMWSLLPNGDVLTVDTNNPGNLTNSERYRPAYGSWISAGSTIVKLPDTNANGSGTHEIGPQLLRPDGTVFAVGATGHTAIYNSVSGTWKAGPDLPVINGLQYTIADGPAALLPSGKVLIAASPGVLQKPTHFFVFDGTTLQQVADTTNAASLTSYYGFMIVLPTGQVMFNSRYGDIELYTDTGVIAPNSAPEITSPVPSPLVAGKSYVLYGKKLKGVSQGAAYAEGYQPDTNFPLVRIVNPATNHVFYARTSAHGTPDTSSVVDFKVPAGIETGPAMLLYAVTNGIASSPISVTVK